jgi:pantoate--beta-alanine ligase
MQRLTEQWRHEHVRIGLVPTMGHLHEGHLSLVARARRAIGKRGCLVVSIYVNPTQFGPREDLKKYPRDLPHDLRLCLEAGVDAVFVPRDQEMYPGGLGNAAEARAFSTFVVEEKLARGMEGISRPTHFRGVATVVAKLFNIVQPDLAVFGAKDYQQAAVVQRMVRDLNFSVRIVVAPTRRELDGLAMSSRNKYLTPSQRTQAVALFQAIRKARELVRGAHAGLPAERLRVELKRLIETHPEARVDYIEFFEPDTLDTVREVHPGAHLALAAFIGGTRLIDNARL